MIKKTVEPTGEVCVKFTDEEMQQLGIKAGEKFSVVEENGGVTLKKHEKIEIDLSTWDRETLEMLIDISCAKDVSINDVVSDLLELQMKN